MKQTYLFFILLSLMIFQGCSSKQYFEPTDTKSLDIDTNTTNGYIIDYNSDGATLDNGKFISVDGVSKLVLSKGFKFLNSCNGNIISADDNNSIEIYKDGKTQKIKLDKTVISATVKDNLLAFGSVDNSISLYDLKKKRIVFTDYLKHSVVNDIKITNPVFLDTIILYPALDGKIVIYNIDKKAVVKSINIDPKSDVNNIIYIQTINDTLIAATSKKLFSFIDGKSKIVDYDIRSVTKHNKNIFISTLDGNLIKFDENLTELKRKKFKFAKFVALGYGDTLFALESQGYLIKLDDNFKKIDIYDFPFDEDEKVIAIGNRLYFEDEYITIK